MRNSPKITDFKFNMEIWSKSDSKHMIKDQVKKTSDQLGEETSEICLWNLFSKEYVIYDFKYALCENTLLNIWNTNFVKTHF